MNKDEDYQMEKISVMEQISNSFFDPELSVGYSGTGFLDGILSARLQAQIYSKRIDNSRVIITTPKPSFMDWFMRRRMVYVFNMDVKDMMLFQDKAPSGLNIRLCDIKKVKQEKI